MCRRGRRHHLSGHAEAFLPRCGFCSSPLAARRGLAKRWSVAGARGESSILEGAIVMSVIVSPHRGCLLAFAMIAAGLSTTVSGAEQRGSAPAAQATQPAAPAAASTRPAAVWPARRSPLPNEPEPEQKALCEGFARLYPAGPQHGPRKWKTTRPKADRLRRDVRWFGAGRGPGDPRPFHAEGDNRGRRPELRRPGHADR